MAKLLLTSTQEVSQKLAQKLAALGHEGIILPFLKIAPLPVSLPLPPKALLITSRHALPAIQDHIGIPLYVVGEETAKLAQAQGHEVIETANTLNLLKPHLPADAVYFRGRDVSQELPVESYICYAAELVTPSAPLPPHNAVVLLSARAAGILPQTPAPIFCLSERIRAALPAAMQQQAIIPADSTEAALLETIKYWNLSQESL